MLTTYTHSVVALRDTSSFEMRVRVPDWAEHSSFLRMGWYLYCKQTALKYDKELTLHLYQYSAFTLIGTFLIGTIRQLG